MISNIRSLGRHLICSGTAIALAAAFLAGGCSSPDGSGQCTQPPFASPIFDNNSDNFLVGPVYARFNLVNAGNRESLLYRDSSGHLYLRVWKNSAWSTAPVDTTSSFSLLAGGSMPMFRLLQVDGKYHVFFSGAIGGAQNWAIWEYAEQPDGTFQGPKVAISGKVFLGEATTESIVISPSKTEKRIALAYSDFTTNEISFAESVDGQQFNAKDLFIQGLVAGAGYDPSGSAWVAYKAGIQPSVQLMLARRAGLNWNGTAATLASDFQLYNTQVVNSPNTGAKPRLVVTWQTVPAVNQATFHGEVFDFGTSTVGPASVVLDIQVNGFASPLFSQMTFSEDGTQTIFSIIDAVGKRAWLTSETNTGFKTPVAYHPALTMTAIPQPYLDSCGKVWAFYSAAEISDPNLSDTFLEQLEASQY